MKFVIVGSGFAGVTFAEKLRTLAPDAIITMITREGDGFYSRPLLSHGFSKANIEQSIILKPFPALAQNRIELFVGSSATAIDRSHKTLTINDGERIIDLEYDKLILAQGSEAFIPPPFRDDCEYFHLLNSLADLKKLRTLRDVLSEQYSPPHWAIIGGGLIGCEVASDLAVAGDKVTLYHAMDRLMERQLVVQDSAKLLTVLQASGVEVRLNQSVTGFRKQDGKTVVVSGATDSFNAVIVACGFKPRTGLAAAAGLAVKRGIAVNPYLQTSDPDVYALGDVAELPDGKLYAFILPIRSQALWLAARLAGASDNQPWLPPVFRPKAKVHGFVADDPQPF